MRHVHINGVPWKYNIGQSMINIWHPVTKKRINVPHSSVVRYSSSDVVPVGPGDVKLYIESWILKTVPQLPPEKRRDPEKQPLTITKVRRKVQDFLDDVEHGLKDNDALHGKEDFLLKQFVLHVATCKDVRADDIRIMAQELLKVIGAKYTRWYA